MNVLHINTLEFTKKLEQAGFERQQAEALVEGIGEIDTSELATKSDIAEVKTDINELRLATKSDIAELKTDIQLLQQFTKADIERLEQTTKSDIAQLEQRMTIKLGGIMIAGVGVILMFDRLFPIATASN